MRFVKRVNERGTLTLPAEIREVLGVQEGDIVEFEAIGVVRKAMGNGAAQNPKEDLRAPGPIPDDPAGVVA